MRHEIGGKRTPWCRLILAGLGLAFVAGCDENGNFMLQPGAADSAPQVRSGNSVKLVERDVEAPDVFQVTDMGLWDGRPSLGGVWVAHPDVKEPERVIIRNMSNSNFVIGALFRRERETPGPALQVSSDAAAALDMLAGAPAQLNVTALRREEASVPVEPEDQGVEPQQDTAGEPLTEPQEIEESALDPVAGAAAAIEAAEAEAEAAPAEEAAPEQKPEPRPAAPRASSPDKPFIQVGIFSVEGNAQNTATAMRQAGMVPTVLEQTSQGKAFWRVIVGPATSTSERGALLKKIQEIGFDDAYPVTN
ncbi:sporulation related domain protein [Roseovarius sp. A-2]|uniref:SPOR domain-containing protein n=1 Tax=Roseovarius sp. A-2 TaxID=1570360 RepID=UPI0009B54BEA|nr:SPOR domain-containing protein [Roseovarius sp. A-2]GAW32972.1 sporulation related domain protein [Roseovarius sp. A-2]